MKQILHKKHTTQIYLFLSYIIAWVIWIPWIIINKNNLSLTDARWFIYAGTFAPSLSAIITWLLTGENIKSRLSNYLNIPNWKLLIKIYFLFPLIVFIGLIISQVLLTNQLISFENFTGNIISIIRLPITSLMVAILFAGPLGEELGWRGFLLPKLLEKYSQIKSSIIIGLVWALWHLPLFIFDSWRNEINLLAYIPIYTTAIILISIILTRIWQRSNQNLFSVIIFHAVFNYLVSRYANVFDDLSNYEYIFSLIIIFTLIILFDKRFPFWKINSTQT